MRTHKENLEVMNLMQEYVEAYLHRVRAIYLQSDISGDCEHLTRFDARCKESASYLDALSLATDDRRKRFWKQCSQIEGDIDAYVDNYELDLDDEENFENRREDLQDIAKSLLKRIEAMGEREIPKKTIYGKASYIQHSWMTRDCKSIIERLDSGLTDDREREQLYLTILDISFSLEQHENLDNLGEKL